MYITTILVIKGCFIACYSPLLLLLMMMVQILRFCGSLVSLKILLLIMRVVCALCLSLILILSEFFRSLGFPAFCVCFYELCNSPRSYRQPDGNGQLLSRRYWKHSVCLFSCASRTARESHGALAVSCKYFKQSKCCLLYTSPSPRDQRGSRMPSSA